jgi:hypothetical protein
MKVSTPRPSAPAVDQDAIADSLEKHVEAFQKTFVWAVLLAAVVGLGSVHGQAGRVNVLGVDIDKASAYDICLGVYTILDGLFITQALSILFAFRQLDDKKVATGATKLLVAPGILNPLACLGPWYGARLISAVSYGTPLVIWWLMYLSTLPLETAAGTRSPLRHVFIASGAMTGWAFAYCYLGILRRLKAADSPMFVEAQFLAWPKLGAAVCFYWVGACLYHILRETSVHTVWAYLDIVFFYPVLLAMPWWGDFRRQWLAVLGTCGAVLAIVALCFGAYQSGTMVAILATILLLLAAWKWKWPRFDRSELLTP